MLYFSFKYTALLILFFLLFSCNKEYLFKKGSFLVLNDTTLLVDGDLGQKMVKKFNKVLEKYPNIKHINFGYCPGSKNDEILFELGRSVNHLDMETHLSANSQVESGAVDLFLAGRKRTIEKGATIGVHAWQDGKKEATEFPENSEEHLPYINYYINCGFSEKESKDFYFFTINAADANGMHYMSEDEILLYKFEK